MTKPLPKFFKDETGYCYVATAMLATQKHLTPWDGAIDAKGFATEAEPVKVAAKPAKPAKAAE